MPLVQAFEKFTVDVLVDNWIYSYSAGSNIYSSEMTNVINAGVREISGSSLCCAQLGLSLLLTGFVGSRSHKLLFDAGPEGVIFQRNCRDLGVELSDVEEVAISHGHWDHMGALTTALDDITLGKRKVRCHVNPGMFFERGLRLKDGTVIPFQNVPSPQELAEHGAEVVNDYAERVLVDGYFYLSGEIPRLTKFEKGREDHSCRENENQKWRPDPFLMDERYLAVHLKNKGLIIFSACSHAGIINVLHNVHKTFSDVPIYCVFGGLHLVGGLEKIIPETVENLKSFGVKQIVPAHCTGWRAVHALLNAFGEEVVAPSAVGSRFTFVS